MKPRSLVYALAVFLSLSASAVVEAQEGPTKGKLGYGFESGLVAGKDFVPGQLIVILKEGMSIQGLAQAAVATGGKISKEIADTAVLLEFGSEGAAVAAVGTLIRRPDVRAVERNGFMSISPPPALPIQKGGRQGSSARDAQVLTVSNDAGTGYQWHHTVIRKTAALPALSATPPTIAVLDTGVDYTHPDLVGKVILGINAIAGNFDPFDDNSHGTHVAGLAAGRAANGDYGEGVCPNCKILAVKVLEANGSGSFFDIATGMHYAHSVATSPPVRVLNMSLGGSGNSLLVAQEVDHIRVAGKVLVASAGNSNTSTVPSFPGADPDTALRVTATTENDCRAAFSNFSPSGIPTRYNIAAPGDAIFSTFPSAGFEAISGTSMASPIVAGAAALVWGQLPALNRVGLIARIVNNGKSISCGFAAATRRLDVRKAILGTAQTAIVGRILDPFSGKAPSPPTIGTNARLRFGAAQLGVDLTNTGGSYEITGLAAGLNRTLRGDRAGYVNAQLRTGIPILAGLVAGPYTDALPKARPTGNATLTLDWKTLQPITDTPGCIDACNGVELDLMVKLPSGAYINSFSNTGDLLTSPFVKNPRDSFDDLQPLETIVIASAAANGVYRVVIAKFNFGANFFNPSWTNSQASVQLYNGATSLNPFFPAPPASCTTQQFWHVGNLTKSGASYAFSPVNACTNTAP